MEPGIRKLEVGSLLSLLPAEAQSFSAFRFEAASFTDKSWNTMMTVKIYFYLLLFTVKLQLQAEERGVVSIKGVSANRFLAMKEDGRLLALVSSAFLTFISMRAGLPRFPCLWFIRQKWALHSSCQLIELWTGKRWVCLPLPRCCKIQLEWPKTKIIV